MSSASQTAANIQNAQLSTGPQTEAGKARSSQNALRHGLASGRILIHDEDPEDFEKLVAALVAQYQPATTTEELLVQQMAQNFWLAQRAIRLQSESFHHSEKRIPPELGVLMRYQTTNERAFEKALATLTKLQQERTKAANGFVSQERELESLGDPLLEPGQDLLTQLMMRAGISGDITQFDGEPILSRDR